jgi:hypothetical protein
VKVLARTVKPGDLLVHGACPAGADRWADEWLRASWGSGPALWSVQMHRYLADWNAYGRTAGMVRNNAMIQDLAPELGDLVLAAWDGTSSGTGHVIEACERLGIPVTVLRFNVADALRG